MGDQHGPQGPSCRVCGEEPAEGSHRLCAVCRSDMLALAGTWGWNSEDPVVQRFVVKLDMGGPVPAHDMALGPCWVWTAATTKRGYGAFKLEGRTVYAHDLAYQWSNGAPVPDGMVHDHLCHDPQTCRMGDACPHRACCSPLHLRATTHYDNAIVRSNSPAALNARQENCGTCELPLSGANLYVPPGGRERQCRACRRLGHQRGEQVRAALRTTTRRRRRTSPGPGQTALSVPESV